MTIAMRLCLLLYACLLGSGCVSLSSAQRQRVEQLVQATRSDQLDCHAADACARPSPLRDLVPAADPAASAEQPRHQVLILDYGQDAMLARLNLIRSATTRIDLQTYIFDEDDAGHLFLDELMAAARRGVQVRVLVDQLSALKRVQTLAALAGAHRNFEIRIFNPVLDRARISYPMYVLAATCCWRRLNQRMHNKLLLIDGAIGITGGRNYQDDYYDWNRDYNFRDRDLLVAGPAVQDMQASFEAYWSARRTRPVHLLGDVGRHLLTNGVPSIEHHAFQRPERVAAIARDADDAQLVRQRLVDAAIPVGAVQFIADLPDKHQRNEPAMAAATRGLRQLVDGTQKELLLQTPYLVLSDEAQAMFRQLHARAQPPRVVVSTNSLAATDSFITYALSYKYKRRYLREFGFTIHEYKPFPEDAPVDVDATGAIDIAWDADGNPIIGPAALRPERPSSRPPLSREYAALRYAGIAVNRRVPLQRAGVRIGLHAKSMVVDGAIGMVGTHNFDPRGDHYNTESAVVIADARFASALADSIRRDISPENSWVIARRDKFPVFSGLDYSLGKVSEQLPLFDLWPFRYATSYQFERSARCPMPVPPEHPQFRQCHRPVGDFPEVALGLKSVLTRIVTAFGSGLAPIL